MPYALPPATATTVVKPALPALPRRKSTSERRAMFTFTPDYDEPSHSKESSSSSSSADTSSATSPLTSPKLPLAVAIPFPSSSQGPPSPTCLPRTPSTPIILPNGKPLKPSLKSSHSSPHLPTSQQSAYRSQSAPSTPNLPPKNVHFPEQPASVRVFRPAGRPAAISLTNADETETETEYDSAAAYPFPSVEPAADAFIALHPDLTSPVPAPSPRADAHVHVETLQLPRARPFTLCGSVLVRNVAFVKNVAVRFTLDDWQTTSEVACRYVSSLPTLPPPFPQAHPLSRLGDQIAHAPGWDRFSFQIRLDDLERKLTERTLFLAVRYTTEPSGEWWDNNAGSNYRVVFRKEAGPPPKQAQRMRAATDGMPPLQLRARPGLHLTFAPERKLPNPTVSPVSPKLSLKNYSAPAPAPTRSDPPSPATTPKAAPPILGLGLGGMMGGQPVTAVGTPPLGSPSDASYAQLVRQWCFHQTSPGPAPVGEPIGAWKEAFGGGMGRGVSVGVEMG